MRAPSQLRRCRVPCSHRPQAAARDDTLTRTRNRGVAAVTAAPAKGERSMDNSFRWWQLLVAFPVVMAGPRFLVALGVTEASPVSEGWGNVLFAAGTVAYMGWSKWKKRPLPLVRSWLSSIPFLLVAPTWIGVRLLESSGTVPASSFTSATGSAAIATIVAAIAWVLVRWRSVTVDAEG